jgi:hypothetical protein
MTLTGSWNTWLEESLEGRIEITGRRGRRRKQLLDDLEEKRRYCKLKEEALDRTLWRTRFGRGYGPVVRQTAEWRGYGTVVRQTTEWRGYGPVVRQTAEWRGYGPVVRQTAEWRGYGPLVRQTAEWRGYGPVVRQTTELTNVNTQHQCTLSVDPKSEKPRAVVHCGQVAHRIS